MSRVRRWRIRRLARRIDALPLTTSSIDELARLIRRKGQLIGREFRGQR